MNFTRWTNRVALSHGAVGAILIFALAGCNREDGTKIYNVPKDENPPTAAAQPAAMPDATAPTPDMAAPPADAAGALPPIKYQLPEGWQEKPAKDMRVASFAAAGPNGQFADVSVIPLPIVGHDLELINMWRSRVQLPATSDPAAVDQAKSVAVGGDQGRLFEFASEQPIQGKARQRLIVVMLTRGTMSWFFKITGDDELVSSQKGKFLGFLKSVSFVDDVPQPIADASAASSASDNANSIWAIPAGWQAVPPAQFLVAEFSVPGTGGGKAEVNVAAMGGNGGGLLPNVNRWRGQIGLAALSDDDLSRVTQQMDILGGTAPQVDFTGVDARTGAPTRLVAVIVSQDGQTWFYKLMGDTRIVAQQKSAFTKFIQSANYANAR